MCGDEVREPGTRSLLLLLTPLVFQQQLSAAGYLLWGLSGQESGTWKGSGCHRTPLKGKQSVSASLTRFTALSSPARERTFPGCTRLLLHGCKRPAVEARNSGITLGRVGCFLPRPILQCPDPGKAATIPATACAHHLNLQR